MRPDRLAFALACAILITAPPTAAHACSCAEWSAQDAFESADVVFEGRIVTLRRDVDADGYDTLAADVEVTRVFRGDVADVEVVGIETASSCAVPPPDVGTTWLLYGRGFGYCSRAYLTGTEAWALQRALLGPGRAQGTQSPHAVPPAPRGGCAHCAVSTHRRPWSWAALVVIVIGITTAARPRRARALGIAVLSLLVTSHGAAQQRVAMGPSHACFLHEGRVACFGAASATGPTPPIVPLDDVVELGAGLAHTCALRRDGSVWCWGGNAHGQVGTRDGMAPFGVVSAPTRVVLEGATELSVGAMHACALTRGGRVLCWGGNVFGELGHAGDGGPAPVELPISDARRVMTGTGVTCVDDAGGARRCFGRDVAPTGSVFAIGMETACDARSTITCDRAELTPLLRTLDVGEIRDAAVNGVAACVAGTTGAVCAGWPSSLVPREPARTDRSSSGDIIGTLGRDVDRAPRAVRVSDVAVREVALGWSAGCVGRDDGVWCWGWGADHVAGVGLEIVPLPVAGIVELVGSPSGLICARTDGGEVWCGPYARTMERVEALPRAIAIAAGGRGACAIAEDRTAWCWRDRERAERVPDLASVTAIAVGAEHACAIVRGDVWCWGANELGQANDELVVLRVERPSRVARAHDAIALELEGSRSCAIGPEGERVWWGGASATSPEQPCEIIDGLVRCGVHLLPIAQPVQLVSDANGVCARGADGRAGCSMWGGRESVWPPRRVPLELWLGR